MRIREAIAHMVECSGKSKYALSLDLGRQNSYIGALLNKGTIPQVNTLVAIADKCGYDLQLVHRNSGDIIKLENIEE